MQTKEEKICSFTQNGTRLQLVKISKLANAMKDSDEIESHYKKGKDSLYYYITYQVRLNRKIISNTISEYVSRKVFATYCQNIVLQLKIY